MAIDPIWSAALTGGLSLAGGVGAGVLSAKQASKQRQFQKHMASTAYQRSMADMRAAGLNPILAYRQGGASTPGGAKAAFENPVPAAVSSALAFRQHTADYWRSVDQARMYRGAGAQHSSQALLNAFTSDLRHQQWRTEVNRTIQAGLENEILASHAASAKWVQEYYQGRVGKWSKKWEQLRKDIGFSGVGGLMSLPIRRGAPINKTFNYGVRR